MTATKRKTTDFDAHIGRRLRYLRVVRGLSQAELAEAADVSYQQVHKYEHGVNRMSAERLWRFAQLLGVPVSDFFDGIESPSKEQARQERVTLKFMQRIATLSHAHQVAVAAVIRVLSSDEEAE
jgi:transcriptional regulator with XRE-family HTH domain